MSSIPWLCVFLAFFCQTFAQQCWFPDGETPSTDIPCDTNGNTSACCGADAFCLNNGLCFGPVISRGSCTDRSWGKGCPQYCAANPDCNLNSGCTVITCNGINSIFTCGHPSNCANNTRTFIMSGGNEFVLRPTQVAGLQLGSGALALSPTTNLTIPNSCNGSTNGSTSVNVSNITTTVTATANSMTANSSSSGETFTAGQMAGIGAGVGVSLLLALLGAGLVIAKQNKRIRSMTAAQSSAPSIVMQGHRNHSPQSQPTLYSSYSQGPQQAAAPYYQPVQQYGNLQEPVREMDGRGQRLEMDARREMQELDNRRSQLEELD